jgi:hypothetical protein
MWFQMKCDETIFDHVVAELDPQTPAIEETKFYSEVRERYFKLGLIPLIYNREFNAKRALRLTKAFADDIDRWNKTESRKLDKEKYGRGLHALLSSQELLENQEMSQEGQHERQEEISRCVDFFAGICTIVALRTAKEAYFRCDLLTAAGYQNGLQQVLLAVIPYLRPQPDVAGLKAAGLEEDIIDGLRDIEGFFGYFQQTYPATITVERNEGTTANKAIDRERLASMQKARQKADSKDKTLEFGLADEMTNEMSLHGKASAKTQMAFDIAEKYKNYSIFQLRRFNNAVLATNSLKSAKTTVTDENGQLSNEGESNQEMGATNKKLRKALLLQFLECHFYLICVDKIQKCLQTVVNLNPNDAKLTEIWKNPKKDPESVFYHFNHARNHLEHINKEIRKGNAELGNLEGADGNIFTYTYLERSIPCENPELEFDRVKRENSDAFVYVKDNAIKVEKRGRFPVTEAELKKVVAIYAQMRDVLQSREISSKQRENDDDSHKFARVFIAGNISEGGIKYNPDGSVSLS